MKVIVGASSYAANNSSAIELLQKNNIEVVLNPYGRKMTEDEVIEQLKDADGILAGLEPLNEKVLSKASKLKALARIGIGMDNVDIAAARERGIRISNTPDAPTEAVAEMYLSVLLCILHQIIPSNADMHQGIWKKRTGLALRDLKVLIIGYGRIGSRFAELLRAFHSEVMIYDPFKPEISIGDLQNALGKADVISINAAGKKEILDSESFEYIKPGCIILNGARGELINEKALYQALKDKKAAYYWGDTFWQEPYSGMLLECENAILTPHIATYTTYCRETMEMEATQNIIRDLGLNPVG